MLSGEDGTSLLGWCTVTHLTTMKETVCSFLCTKNTIVWAI